MADDKPEPFVLRLRHPFDFGSERVEELRLQPLTARELWELPTPTPGSPIPLGAILAMGAKCAGVSDALVKRLHVEDAMALVEHLGEQFGGSLPTGH